MIRSWLCAALALLVTACGPSAAETESPLPADTEIVAPMDTPPESQEDFTLISPGYIEGETIPDRFACTGANLSPELSWSKAPSGTESLALIFDDPDAPGGTWVHWILFNIPGETTVLPEGFSRSPTIDSGASLGSNSWGTLDYGGPCPPPGSTHRYVFTLYALDVSLGLEPGTSKGELLAAMEGLILGQAVLTGTFSR